MKSLCSSLHLLICNVTGLQVVTESFSRTVNSISVFCTWTFKKFHLENQNDFVGCWLLVSVPPVPHVMPQRLSAAHATASGYKVVCRLVVYTNKAHYTSLLLVRLPLSSWESTRTKSFCGSLWGPPLSTGCKHFDKMTCAEVGNWNWLLPALFLALFLWKTCKVRIRKRFLKQKGFSQFHWANQNSWFCCLNPQTFSQPSLNSSYVQRQALVLWETPPFKFLWYQGSFPGISILPPRSLAWGPTLYDWDPAVRSASRSWTWGENTLVALLFLTWKGERRRRT